MRHKNPHTTLYYYHPATLQAGNEVNAAAALSTMKRTTNEDQAQELVEVLMRDQVSAPSRRWHSALNENQKQDHAHAAEPQVQDDDVTFAAVPDRGHLQRASMFAWRSFETDVTEATEDYVDELRSWLQLVPVRPDPPQEARST